MGKNSQQEDRLTKSFGTTVEGVSFDGIVAKARLWGARIFDTSTDQIYVHGTNLRPSRMTRFRANLSVESRPVTWALDVIVGVKDRDED